MRKEAGLFGPLAEDYAKYRPGYPPQVIEELVRACGLTRDWTVADIGSGTGNAARLFLEAGCEVIGVEPDREMREAGERLLASYRGFRSFEGTAEQIPIESQAADLISVGQALHWFDVDRARSEFQRVLRPGGWVAVMWNDRLPDASAFACEYAELICFCAAKQPSPCHACSLRDGLDRLFSSSAPHHAAFVHTQSFDLNGLLGRARSSGYLPQPEARDYPQLAALLTGLFSRHQQCGTVQFHYTTQLYYGRIPRV